MATKTSTAVRRADQERRKAGRKTKAAVDTPGVQIVMRFGYVARGLIYGVIGVLAFTEAIGLGGPKTDPKGALAVIAHLPGGGLVLTVIVVGLAGYATWCFVCALFDPLRHRSDPPGLARRLGFVAAGIGDLALLAFAIGILSGHGAKGGGPASLVGRALSLPIGRPLVVVVGAIVLVVGTGQFVAGIRAGFERDLDERRMNEEQRHLAANLGRAGYAARGVVYTLIGWFTIQAGLSRDATHAEGFGGAFTALERQPFGHFLLAAVAIGFVALGAHSLAAAVWIRMTVR